MSGDRFYDPEYTGDLNTLWECESCHAKNSPVDGECQFCEHKTRNLSGTEPDPYTVLTLYKNGSPMLVEAFATLSEAEKAAEQRSYESNVGHVNVSLDVSWFASGKKYPVIPHPGHAS